MMINFCSVAVNLESAPECFIMVCEEDAMDNIEICYLSVVEMAEVVKTRKLSPVEIMGAVLSRIERLQME